MTKKNAKTQTYYQKKYMLVQLARKYAIKIKNKIFIYLL